MTLLLDPGAAPPAHGAYPRVHGCLGGRSAAGLPARPFGVEAQVAVTEESRHRLFSRLEQVLGSEEAAARMEHVPPVGWADVATRRDLDLLRSELSAGLDVRRAELSGGLDRLRAELYRSQRQLLFGFVAGQAAFVGVVAALVG